MEAKISCKSKSDAKEIMAVAIVTRNFLTTKGNTVMADFPSLGDLGYFMAVSTFVIEKSVEVTIEVPSFEAEIKESGDDSRKIDILQELDKLIVGEYS